MKIKYEIDSNVKFKDLKAGDIFEFTQGGSLFMKIHPIINNQSECFSCVSLEDGRCYSCNFDDCNDTIKVDAELVVKSEGR